MDGKHLTAEEFLLLETCHQWKIWLHLEHTESKISGVEPSTVCLKNSPALGDYNVHSRLRITGTGGLGENRA